MSDENGPQHPEFAAALLSNDYRSLIGIALRARLAADEDGRYCECDQWEGVVYDLDAAHARIADLIVERDAYMQALLDTIHALASKPPAASGAAPDEEENKHG